MMWLYLVMGLLLTVFVVVMLTYEAKKFRRSRTSHLAANIALSVLYLWIAWSPLYDLYHKNDKLLAIRVVAPQPPVDWMFPH